MSLEAARADGLKVVPLCPFIAAWMKKHPEYDDLRLSDTDRARSLRIARGASQAWVDPESLSHGSPSATMQAPPSGIVARIVHAPSSDT